MGMYTEIVFKASVSKKLPEQILNILKFMFNDEDESEHSELPNHVFFKCPRWSFIGHGSSFYHHPRVVNSWCDTDYSSDIQIFSRSDFKNYDGEIEKFFDWVSPYLEEPEGVCIGYSWYEGCTEPTLYYRDSRVLFAQRFAPES